MVELAPKSPAMSRIRLERLQIAIERWQLNSIARTAEGLSDRTASIDDDIVTVSSPEATGSVRQVEVERFSRNRATHLKVVVSRSSEIGVSTPEPDISAIMQDYSGGEEDGLARTFESWRSRGDNTLPIYDIYRDMNYAKRLLAGTSVGAMATGSSTELGE